MMDTDIVGIMAWETAAAKEEEELYYIFRNIRRKQGWTVCWERSVDFPVMHQTAGESGNESTRPYVALFKPW